MKTYFIAAALVFIFGLCVDNARALDIEIKHIGEKTVLALSGSITAKDHLRVAAKLKGQTVHEVWLNSSGGSLGAGIRIGQILRNRRLSTRIPGTSICASACVHVFAGGVIREVDADARIGVHMASMSNDDYISRIRKVLTDESELTIDERIKLIVQISEQFSAYAVTAQVGHYQKMGVSLNILLPSAMTAHYEIHWLSRQDLKELNVVNVD